MSAILYAKDFGILPDRYKNSLAEINAMLDGIEPSDEVTTIVFESGKYTLSYDEATERDIHITNTTTEKESKGRTHKVGIYLDGKKNIVIDGNGSLFMVNGEMIMLMLNRCTNIEFRNVAFDYVRPTMTELTIDKSTMTSLECTINKGAKYRIEDGKIVFFGDNFETRKPHYTLIYDKDENATFKSSYSPIKTALSISEMEPYKIKISSVPRTTTEKIYEGLTFEVRNNIKSAVGVFINKSKNIRFENVSFHYMHGLGIVGQLSKDLKFDHVSCAPRPQTGRHNSAFSDMMHFSMCNGKISITNSKFSGAGADAINIHGTYLIVKQKVSDRRILLEFPEPATYGFDAFKVGDDIEGIDVLSHNLQWANKIKAVKAVDKTTMLVDFVTPFDGVKVGQAVENVTKTPAVDIIGNSFDNIPARCILVTTRQKVNISRNTFDKIADSVIYIAGDTSSWYESGRVMNVTIEKNEFNKCAFNTGKPVIYIAPKNVIPNAKTPVHKGIKVIDNVFDLAKSVAFSAKSTSDILLSNNRYEGEHGTKPLYKLNACSNVSIVNEDYTTGKSKLSCMLMDRKKEVTIK